MSEERSFVHGFRPSHTRKSLIIFATAVVFDVAMLAIATTTLSRVLWGMAGAFFIYMIAVMLIGASMRRRGERRIVVGANALTAPSGPLWRSPFVDVPYTAMRSVSSTPGSQGKLRVEYDGGTITISCQELGTDAEFDELVALVKQRAAKR